MTFAIIKIIVSFVISLAFGVLLEVPKKFLLHVSIIGAFGRFIYILLTENEHSIVFATFVATTVIAILSHTLARIVKAPVTVFLIAGILPLVPGMGMYNIVYYFLKSDIRLASEATLATFMVAGAIALAIFIVDSVFKVSKIKLFQR